MKIDLKMAKEYTFAFCLIGLIMIISNSACATAKGGLADSNTLSQTICKAVQLLQGGIGKAVATIAIIVLGLGLFMGKLNWQIALATAIGIGLIFGATGIVGVLTDGSDYSCAVTS